MTRAKRTETRQATLAGLCLALLLAGCSDAGSGLAPLDGGTEGGAPPPENTAALCQDGEDNDGDGDADCDDEQCAIFVVCGGTTTADSGGPAPDSAPLPDVAAPADAGQPDIPVDAGPADSAPDIPVDGQQPDSAVDAGVADLAIDAPVPDATVDTLAADSTADTLAADTTVDTLAGTDAGTDLGTDLGSDIGTDLGADAGTDLGTDLGSDIGTDLGADAGTDLGTDAGTDIGTSCGNGVCDPNESCDGDPHPDTSATTRSCPADCPGLSTGALSGRYCCFGDICDGTGCADDPDNPGNPVVCNP